MLDLGVGFGSLIWGLDSLGLPRFGTLSSLHVILVHANALVPEWRNLVQSLDISRVFDSLEAARLPSHRLQSHTIRKPQRSRSVSLRVAS